MKEFLYKLFLLIVSGTISLAIGSTMYFRFIESRNVLGESTSIVKVPKELLVFHQDPQLPGYYDLASSRTYVDKVDWEPGTATYTLNAHGMNDAREYAVQKSPETLRIMTIGDSFTFGQFVNTEDSYPKRLSSLLIQNNCNDGKPVEVMNLGVPGYDIQYTVEHFNRIGARFNPDIVVWLINEHNVYQVREKIASIAAILADTASEEEKQGYKAVGNYYWSMNKGMEIFVMQNSKKGVLDEQKNYLNRFAKNFKGKLLVVMFDDADQSAKNMLREFTEYREDSYFSANLPNLVKLKATLPDSHPSIYGHTVIATYIYQQLADLHLIQCTQ